MHIKLLLLLSTERMDIYRRRSPLVRFSSEIITDEHYLPSFDPISQSLLVLHPDFLNFPILNEAAIIYNNLLGWALGWVTNFGIK